VLRNLIILVLLACLAFAGFWLLTVPSVIPASALGPHTPNLANGKTMFYAGGCASCHAVPDQDDKTRLGGGLGLKTAFGTFYVPNISPDPADGIGSWNEAQFVTALVKGTSPDSRHYYPAFPYTSFQRMKFDDLRDLFAYLRTLPAVQDTVQEHDLPLYFKIRRTLGIWKLLFLDGRPFTPDPTQSAQWNRGAYLVNGPGHCAECHSPRNFLGGIISSQRFAGGPDPEGKDWIPNITQKGIGDWSEHEIATMLETGETPDDRVAGVMKEVVANTAQLSAEDRMAMAVYVKSLPPVEGPKKPEKE
jgi:mono/diheme cytochrome c family protein